MSVTVILLVVLTFKSGYVCLFFKPGGVQLFFLGGVVLFFCFFIERGCILPSSGDEYG